MQISFENSLDFSIYFQLVFNYYILYLNLNPI